MTPELEVLDQLSGGDLPLDVIAQLFPEPERCQRAVAAMLDDGQVKILAADGNAVPSWKYAELRSDPRFWGKGTSYRMSITERGASSIA